MGSAPRTLARAPDGTIWVVNQGSELVQLDRAGMPALPVFPPGSPFTFRPASPRLCQSTASSAVKTTRPVAAPGPAFR